jgi:TonB-dependent starch-binding outer membrane protein SusC
MRKRVFTGKLFLFTMTFMGISHAMHASTYECPLLFSFMQVDGGAQGQSLVMEGQNDSGEPITSILSEARKVFDVDFIYESRILPVARVVMDVGKFKTVEKFLDKLLGPYHLKYKKVLSKDYVIYSSKTELKELLSILGQPNSDEPAAGGTENKPASPEARPNIITGRISEEGKGTPLEGVSVIVKGTTQGTITAKGGRFRLEVGDPHAVLVFSVIGYQPREMEAGTRRDIQVTLVSTSQSLNDVVVIGYGTQKKSAVTGAISSLKSSDLENMPVNRIEESLQGRVSGVMITANSGSPGSPSTVTIRGVTSINNSNPLYIVDGVPIDVSGLDYLNQADIASIEVLKDAASAAIYGTRAAAGVILITTRKGRPGPMQISYSGVYGAQASTRRLSLLNATQYGTLRNESSVAAGDGVIFPNVQALGKGTDWQNTIFNDDAAIQNHLLSISGGNDRSTYYTSFGYFDQQGIVTTPISYYKRYTAKLNITHKIKDWLNFGNNIAYAYIRSQSVGNTNSPFGGPLSSAINMDPVTPVVITDPAVLARNPYNTEPVLKDAQGQPYGISNFVGQEITNPLAYIQTQEGYNWTHNIVGNVFAEVEPVRNVKFRSSIGAKLAFFGKQTFVPIYYLNASTSNLINNSYYRENDQSLIWNWDNTVSWTYNTGLHHFTALGGTSAQKNTGSGTNATYYGLPVTNLRSASLNYNVDPSDRLAGGYENQPYAISSVFGRITYDYDEKYLFTGIVRRDGSSRFGGNNRYGNFPSVSAGWVPTKEGFWPAGTHVDFLKIRAGYGVNGNDQSLPDFQFVSTVGGGRNYVFGNNDIIVGYSPNAPGNPALKWEQTSQADLGFDATIFHYFQVTFDAYNKKTNGMLLQEQIPGFAGAAGEPYGNVASLQDKGLELELGYTQQIGKVSLDLSGNASYVINKITSLGLSNSFFTAATFQSSAYEISRIAVGQPLDVFYGFKPVGIFQTLDQVKDYTNKGGQEIQPNARPGDLKFADLSGDDQLSSADRTYLGDPTPHWIFGFTARAQWKGFYVDLVAQGVSGNKIFQGYRRLDIQGANYMTKALGRWTGTGTSNDYPRLVDGDPNGNFSNPSSFYLQSGAYLRVKVLQFGYSLPRQVTDRLHLQKVLLYISGNNLFTFTKYDGLSPEIGGNSGVASAINTGSGSANNYGVDNGVYPAARTVQVGINVTL